MDRYSLPFSPCAQGVILAIQLTILHQTGRLTSLTRQVTGQSENVLRSLGASVPDKECSIYILDPARDVGIPGCDFTDPSIWPFATDDNRYQASGPLQHWEQQHAVNFWVARAIEASGYATTDRFAADIVFINSHCYEQWRLGWHFYSRQQNISVPGAVSPPDEHLRRAMRYIRTWPQWRETKGARFVVTPFWPSTPQETRTAMRPCKYVVGGDMARRTPYGRIICPNVNK